MVKEIVLGGSGLLMKRDRQSVVADGFDRCLLEIQTQYSELAKLICKMEGADYTIKVAYNMFLHWYWKKTPAKF